MKTKGTRHNAREFALCILYSYEIQQRADYLPFHPPTPEIWNGEEDFSIPHTSETYALRLVHGVLDCREEIDELLRTQSHQWRLERMSLIDKNILRLAVYEMFHEPRSPLRVVLDEALELAKGYGDDQSFRFVNGLLDPIARNVEEAGSGARELPRASSPESKDASVG